MEIYTLLFWAASIILGWILLYFVVKAAVVNGIRDSGLLERERKNQTEQKIHDTSPNSAQILLKQRYEKGELTFNAYVEEWNKLK